MVLFLAAILDLVLVFWTEMVLSFSSVVLIFISDSFSPVLIISLRNQQKKKLLVSLQINLGQ